MLTFCPEIKGGNYIAVQRRRKKSSLHTLKPFLNPSRESTVASSTTAIGFVSVTCSYLLDFQNIKNKIEQGAPLLGLCLPGGKEHSLPCCVQLEGLWLFLLALALYLPLEGDVAAIVAKVHLGI